MPSSANWTEPTGVPPVDETPAVSVTVRRVAAAVSVVVVSAAGSTLVTCTVTGCDEDAANWSPAALSS